MKDNCSKCVESRNLGLKFCRHCGEILENEKKESQPTVDGAVEKSDNLEPEFSAKGMSPEKFREEVEKRVEHKGSFGKIGITPILLAVSIGVILILGGALIYSRSKNTSDYTSQVNNLWRDFIEQADKLNTRTNKLVNVADLSDYENDLGPIGREVKNINFDLDDIDSSIVPNEYEDLQDRLIDFGDELDGYIERIKFLIRSLDQIEKEEELKVFDNKGDDLEQSYDDLILANDGVLKKSFPRETFKIVDNLKLIAVKYLEDKLAEEEDKEEGGDAVDRVAAQESVKGFMDAYLLNDESQMKEFMTTEAINEFSYDYWFAGDFETLDYRVLSTNYIDVSSFEIVAREQDETSDGYKYTVDRLFKVIKADDKWLIDVVSYSYG